MPRKLHFYFDFMSPFAYLAHQRVPALAKKYGYQPVYHPIDLPAAKLAVGNTAPPNVSMPIKLRYLSKDLERWAQRYGVALKFPKSLESERVNKGFFYAAERGQALAYCSDVWHRTWGCGGDPRAPALLDDVAREMGWNSADFSGFLNSEPAQAQFDESNKQAQQKGVFGAPTMIIGKQMWWGNDRLDFVEETMQESAPG